MVRSRVLLLLVAITVGPSAAAQDLRVQLVGNAGVMLSDGVTALLLDLPYQPGAYGYERYDPDALQPTGAVVSVITHDHIDHFDPALFLTRAAWRVIGPPSVIRGLPAERVLPGDSLTVGAFTVVALATPHTPDHRSYRVRWRGRVLHFSGDTEWPASVPPRVPLDVLFITPWLLCAITDAGVIVQADRVMVYHRNPDGSDRRCGAAPAGDRDRAFVITP